MANLLLVEDDPNLRDLFSEVLRTQGHIVTTANNGREGLERLAEAEFDFVLMDIQMPEMDGIAATRAIRASDASFNEIPIFALTNLQLPEEVSSALDAGVDGYIAKPLDPHDLAQELQVLLTSEE